MNNNQISNQKKEVPKGMDLNEKDAISFLINNLKEIASCESLYNVYKEAFLNISELQREVYEIMFRKGWYILEKSDVNKINSKHQMLLQEYQDLNN